MKSSKKGKAKDDLASRLRMVDVRNKSLLWQLDQYMWGPPRERSVHLNFARRSAILNNLARFEPGHTLVKFQRRITALCWHPQTAYLAAAACKGGDVTVARRIIKDSSDSRCFQATPLLRGIGPGGAIFSIKFNPQDENILYTASLDGTVRRLDVNNIGKEAFVYHDFQEWSLWHTAMDVSLMNGVIMACDNKGYARLFDIRDGSKAPCIRLHKSKIHHCEFNPKVPHLIATAGLDAQSAVSLWDLRTLGEGKTQAVKKIEEDCIKAVNVATFNPSGSRVLINDQKDVIKAYEGPLWNEYLTFRHPHRQFQHLTGIEASWHPLEDLIVVGTYPEVPKGTNPAPPRPVDIFDGSTGELLQQLYHPLNGIISLNQFNPNGEILSSGMGLNWVLWQPSNHLEKLRIGAGKNSSSEASSLSSTMFQALRGHGRTCRQGSDSDDDDDIEISKAKKRAKTRSSRRVGASPAAQCASTSKKSESAKVVQKLKSNEKEATASAASKSSIAGKAKENSAAPAPSTSRGIKRGKEALKENDKPSTSDAGDSKSRKRGRR